MSEQPVETLHVTVLRSDLEELRAKAGSLPVGVPDAEWVMHLLNDRWPESSERVEVELFADWLREVIAAPAAQPVAAPDGYVSVIAVEKLLCQKLGIEWAADGISIESLAERLAAAQPVAEQGGAAGGVYSSDPLACSGCASGCFRCLDALQAVTSSLRHFMGCFGQGRLQDGQALDAADALLSRHSAEVPGHE